MSIRYLLPFVLLGSIASAQTPVYITQLGGTAMDQGGGVAIGPNNEHYFTGSVIAPADLDLGGPGGTVSSTGNADIFLTKRASDGTFEWGFTVGGSSLDEGIDLAIASNGDVIVTGTFYTSADMDPGPGDGTIVDNGSNPSSPSTFIARYTDQGQFVWAKQFSGINAGSYVSTIAIDDIDRMYLTGWFDGPVDFDPSLNFNVINYIGNSSDAFVCALDDSGDFLWAKLIGGTASTWGLDIGVNAAGEVLVGGWHMGGTCDLDPGMATVEYTTPANKKSGWAVKLDNSGNYLWSADFGGNDQCSVNAVMFAPNGAAFLGAGFRGTYDVDPGPAIDSLASEAYLDGLVIKLNGTDGQLIQYHHLGGSFSNPVERFAKANDGTFYYSGQGGISEDFDPGPGVVQIMSTLRTVTCHYDTAFAFLGVYGIEVWSNSFEQDMAVDLDGNVVAVGYFNNSGDFDPSANTLTLSTLGDWDVYISSIGDLPTGIRPDMAHSAGPTVAPNPGSGSFTLSLPAHTERLDVVDEDGRLVKQMRTSSTSATLDLTTERKGVYFIRAVGKASVHVVRVVVQ